MPTYFRPLRRKLGLITLLMACVFTTGWVRSFTVEDRIDWSSLTGSPIEEGAVGLLTKRNSLVLFRQEFKEFRGVITSQNPATNSMSVSLVPKQEDATVDRDSKIEISSPASTVHMNSDVEESSAYAILLQVPHLVIPYWTIVVPLTAVSAWLLLSKSRRRNPTSEPPV